MRHLLVELGSNRFYRACMEHACYTMPKVDETRVGCFYRTYYATWHRKLELEEFAARMLIIRRWSQRWHMSEFHSGDGLFRKECAPWLWEVELDYPNRRTSEKWYDAPVEDRWYDASVENPYYFQRCRKQRKATKTTSQQIEDKYHIVWCSYMINHNHIRKLSYYN